MITSDDRSKKTIRATNKAITSVDSRSTLGGQTKTQNIKRQDYDVRSYADLGQSDQSSDTEERTSEFRTVSPMQHLQAVKFKAFTLLFGEQCRTAPPIVHIQFIVTHYFSLGLKKLGPWVRNLAHLLCSSIYTI